MMSFGGVGSRVFMDDLVFQRLWLQKQESLQRADDTDDEINTSEEEDGDIRKLFPRKNLKKKQLAKRKIQTSGKATDPPEWLAIFVGVFFVAGVAGIASYQAYKQDSMGELSQMEFHFNDIAHDAPVDLDVYDELFLPKALIPKHYVLYIAPNFTAKQYTGLVKITVQCQSETGQVILHSDRHNLRKVEIKPKNQSESDFKVIDTLRNRDKQFVIFDTDQTFQIGHVYDIFIGFGSTLMYDTSNGFYLSDYRDADGKKHTMVSTDFEPALARNAFPCFDEPELKASFKIILLHEKTGFTAISNMPVKKLVNYGKDKVETHFDDTPVMSTYLVVFIVTEYRYKETASTSGVSSKVYAPEGRLAETDVALNVAPICVDYYEKSFGVKFSLPKLDLIPITKLSAAADETWGGIIFEEQELLYDVTSGSVNQLEKVASVIAHEIAHQWFGDLVTMSWWNDLWLKESFANYLQALPITKYYPSWDFKTQFYLSTIAPAFGADSSDFTHPIHSDEMDPKKLRLVYDAITYDKGAAVVSMLANFLGEETFFKGVNIYLNRYAYQNANSSQFWEAISEAAPSVNVTQFMNSWIRKPGFPVIFIKHQENGSFEVVQKKYSRSNTENNATPESSSWEVPLVIKSSDTKVAFSTVFKAGHQNYVTGLTGVDTSNGWYKANYGGTGFYRVNYEEENWKKLLNLLTNNHTALPAIDRANLLDDISALAVADYQNLKTALDFTTYLSEEHHYVPWEVGTGLLNLIHSVFYNTNLKGCVERHILNLIKPVLTYLNTEQTHDHIQKHLISYLLSLEVNYNETDIVNELNNRFLKWVVSGSRDEIPASIRSNVFLTGIKYGEHYEWDYLFKYYEQSSSNSERQLLLSVLTKTQDMNSIKKFLNILVNTTTIPSWEQDRAYQHICLNRFAKQLAWEQVKRNFDTILERDQANPRMTSFILQACLDSGKTQEDLNDAKAFFKEYLPDRLKIFGDKILETISHKINLIKRQSEIEEWFKKNDPTCLS